MDRGNLIVYGLDGTIYNQTGECSGETVKPHVLPVGVPYLEIPYGEMKYGTHFLQSIDVSDTQNPRPIFVEIERTPSPQEQIEQLENELLIAKGVI